MQKECGCSVCSVMGRAHSPMNVCETLQAYEGLETVARLREEYIFVPAKVKEVYLFHLLSRLEDLGIRSAIVFLGTCKSCHLLDLLLEELGISCVALHSHKTQGRRLAALDK